jgi:imidazolonepropionase-like amidohydrolase
MAALVSATSLSAESLRLGDQIGSLEPGMQADIVGFDGDPLRDVNAARRAVFVMKGGKVYENLQPGSKAKTPEHGPAR